MHLRCDIPTKKVTFHSVGLELDPQSLLFVSENNQTDIRADKFLVYDKSREYFTVELSKDCVNQTNYVFSVKFKGGIESSLFGFYRSSYKNPQGETR